MILEPEIIQNIREGNVAAHNIGFTTTERCNLRCSVCYLGEPRRVDMNPEIPNEVFKHIKDTDAIFLGGAESQLNPRGLEQIANAAAKHGAKFKRLQFVTNGTFINKPFWEILDGIMDANPMTRIYADISNDEWHKDSVEIKGYGVYKKLIYDNYEKLRQMYPQFDISIRSFMPYDESFIRPSGKGKYIEGNREFNEDRKDFKFDNDITVYKPFAGSSRGDRPVVDTIQFDAYGNTVQMWRDLQGREQENFGNIFKKPLPEIIIEHGYES